MKSVNLRWFLLALLLLAGYVAVRVFWIPSPAGLHLNQARYDHRTALLNNDSVLVVGGVKIDTEFPNSLLVFGEATRSQTDVLTWELFNLKSGSTESGTVDADPNGCTLTPLSNGKVLFAGGDFGHPQCSLFDPTTHRWTATGEYVEKRNYGTNVELVDGRVLSIGGWGRGILASCELYSPLTQTWITTGSLIHAREIPVAVRLSNGIVLAAGGGTDEPLYFRELYDPFSGKWRVTGRMSNARRQHAAIVLPDGKVLVAGGVYVGGPVSECELFDPNLGTWSKTGSLLSTRNPGGRLALDHYSNLTLLQSGEVLFSGGLAPCQLYSPKTGLWRLTGQPFAQSNYSITQLKNGTVLVSGGQTTDQVTDVCQIYETATGTWVTAR